MLPCTQLLVSAFDSSIFFYARLGAFTYSLAVYSNVGHKYKLEWPTTILAVLALIVTIPIYIFYWKGPSIRAKSKFAQTLASDMKARGGRGSIAAKDAEQPSHVEEA